MKAYSKIISRMFKKHITRFFSIICMVAISVGFIAGIGSGADKIQHSMSEYYQRQNVSDFIVKSTGEGFTEEDIAAIEGEYGAENVNTGMSLDVNVTVNGEKQLTRLYFLDFERWTVNVPERTEGEEATEMTQIYAESADHNIIGCAVGDAIELDFKDIIDQLYEQQGEEMDPWISEFLESYLRPQEVTVSGIVQSPLTFAMDGEPSYTNPEDTEIPDTIGDVNKLITLENILYVSAELIPEIMGNRLLPTGDIYIAIQDRNVFDGFSSKYETLVGEQKEKISGLLGEESRVLTLYDNYSFVSLNSYGIKVKAIGMVLMVAFLFVTILVVLSNMMRLMEEERGQIACQKTLGYSSPRVIMKYVLFVLLGACVGGAGAYFVNIGLAFLIYHIFYYSFAMPPISAYLPVIFFLIIFSIILVTSLGTTVISGLNMTAETPANLLRPKPPRAGRKILLEKWKLVWNRLSFKYKSTLRNVLRYKSRFIMTVVSVAVSTALVMAGLALLDVCLFGGLESMSVMAISLVVVAFAGLLTMVVIYTLTNINISERNRELATLMVLGYFDGEVSGYIYREIYIDTIVGILFGYPLSLFIIKMVFDVMGMGSIEGITWFWWLVAPVVVLVFTFLVTIILRRKIVKIDMNESLKAIE